MSDARDNELDDSQRRKSAARPPRPVRPPAPGMKPVDVVPAQAPKPSLDRSAQSQVRAAPETRERPAEPAPLETPAFITPDDDLGLGEIHGDEEVNEDDLVAVPAPSPEMLMSSGLRHAAMPRAIKRQASVTLQRTLIPILLTLALLLPGIGVWLILHPEESELRAYGQKLLIYLIIGGAVFLALAIVNMIQVRAVLQAR